MSKLHLWDEPTAPEWENAGVIQGQFSTFAPLRGLKVIDLTRYYPGPLAGHFLSQMGSSVIKLENRERPDLLASLPPVVKGVGGAYLFLNRHKLIWRVSWKSPSGQRLIERFPELFEQADAVITQYKTSTLEKFGLAPKQLSARFPHLLVCELCGFDADGPKANAVGHDLNYLAESGLLSMFSPHLEGPLPIQLADVVGGSYTAVIALLGALFQRHRTATGQHLVVSMSRAALPLGSLQLPAILAKHQGVDPLSGALPCYGLYGTADNGSVALGALEPSLWANFCKAVNRLDLLPHGWDEGENAEPVKTALQQLFREKTSQEWALLAQKHQLALTPVRHSLEVLEKEATWFRQDDLPELLFPVSLGSDPHTSSSD
jgi:crotonobetainyl-CoA:carnitine CoA-transferase CaiB-like acyl-CoA transferase